MFTFFLYVVDRKRTCYYFIIWIMCSHHQHVDILTCKMIIRYAPLLNGEKKNEVEAFTTLISVRYALNKSVAVAKRRRGIHHHGPWKKSTDDEAIFPHTLLVSPITIFRRRIVFNEMRSEINEQNDNVPSL